MIIWGNRTKREGRGFVLKSCAYCAGDQVHFVAQSKTKFTLYFVPTITTSTKALLICTQCEREETIDGAQAQTFLRAAMPRELMVAELRGRAGGSNGSRPGGAGSRGSPGSPGSESPTHALAVGMVVLALQVALADGTVDDGEAVAVRRGLETIQSATRSTAVRNAAGMVLSDFEGIMAFIRSPATGPLTLMLAQTGQVLSQSPTEDQSRYIGQLAWLCDKVIASHDGPDVVERDQMDAGFEAIGFDTRAVAGALSFCELNGG